MKEITFYIDNEFKDFITEEDIEENKDFLCLVSALFQSFEFNFSKIQIENIADEKYIVEIFT